MCYMSWKNNSCFLSFALSFTEPPLFLIWRILDLRREEREKKKEAMVVVVVVKGGRGSWSGVGMSLSDMPPARTPAYTHAHLPKAETTTISSPPQIYLISPVFILFSRHPPIMCSLRFLAVSTYHFPTLRERTVCTFATPVGCSITGSSSSSKQ